MILRRYAELSKSERLQVRNVYGLARVRLYGYAFAHGLLQTRQPLSAVRCYADWRAHFEQTCRLVTVEDRGAEFVRAKGWDNALMDEAEAWVAWGRGRFRGR